MKGIIIRGIGGFYYIKTSEGVFECKARGKFRYNDLKPMVGDWVEISLEGEKGVIEKIYERSSELIRPTVANVTQAFVVFAIKNPDLNFDLLNRFLVLCEHNNIKAIVCLNKVDLCSQSEVDKLVSMINGIGYEVLILNAKSGRGLEILSEKLNDNVTVLCGPSGAGKSTLMNNLSGHKFMEVGDISEKIGRGKHTTRHSELIDLGRGFIVDTPGFSTLDINFIDKDELKFSFPEFNEYSICKFAGCNHYKEPQCGVREAVEEGKINIFRYEFYVKTLEEIMNSRKKW